MGIRSPSYRRTGARRDGDHSRALGCGRVALQSKGRIAGRADLDHDGDTDLADLLTFQAAFTGAR